MYAVNVLADSIGPHGIRLTTVEATFPRNILAELNTHRMMSRNSESSRAIPPEIQIARVKTNPYIPPFGMRVKGMGVGEALEGDLEERARRRWLEARDDAVTAAEAFLDLGIAKEQINRLLEPFMWHTAIISGTEWDNMLNLRDHADASPSFRPLAAKIRSALRSSDPTYLRYGDWHLPLVSSFERELADLNNEAGGGVSAGRCARSSYSTHNNPETPNESADRWGRLLRSGHWSPGEHPAMCVPDRGYQGNFRGFKQLRKFYPFEAVFQNG